MISPFRRCFKFLLLQRSKAFSSFFDSNPLYLYILPTDCSVFVLNLACSFYLFSFNILFFYDFLFQVGREFRIIKSCHYTWQVPDQNFILMLKKYACFKYISYWRKIFYKKRCLMPCCSFIEKWCDSLATKYD